MQKTSVFLSNVPIVEGLSLNNPVQDEIKLRGISVQDKLVIEGLTQREQMSFYNTLWLYYINLAEEVQKFISPEVAIWLEAQALQTHKDLTMQADTAIELDASVKLHGSEFTGGSIEMNLLVSQFYLVAMLYHSGKNEINIDAMPIPSIDIDYIIHPSGVKLILDALLKTSKSGTAGGKTAIWFDAAAQAYKYAVIYPEQTKITVDASIQGLVKAGWRMLGQMDEFPLSDYDDMTLGDVDIYYIY